MWYLGIDPGQKGGIALFYPDGENTDIEVVPYSDGELLRMAEFMSHCRCRCCLEHVHALPKQGVTSTFNFGAGFGYIRGVLESHKIPYQLITPQKWKAEFGLNSDKQKSVEVCRRLFPDVNLLATPRCRVAHDGMAEALLMSEYARRKL